MCFVENDYRFIIVRVKRKKREKEREKTKRYQVRPIDKTRKTGSTTTNRTNVVLWNEFKKDLRFRQYSRIKSKKKKELILFILQIKNTY